MVEKNKIDGLDKTVGKLDQVVDVAKHIFSVGGGVYTVIDVVGNMFGNEPSKRSHPVGKLAHGGLFSFDDQIAMHEFEVEMTEKPLLTCLEIFRIWTSDGYGNGFFGKIFDTVYKNRFRAMVVRMRKPIVRKVTEPTVALKDEINIEEKTENTTGTNKKAVEFLNAFGEVIKSKLESSFDINEFDILNYKREDVDKACRHACKWLAQKSMPVPSFMDNVSHWDKSLSGANLEKLRASVERDRTNEANLSPFQRWLG